MAFNHYLIDSKGKCKIDHQNDSINIQIEDIINLTENSKIKIINKKIINNTKQCRFEKNNRIIRIVKSISKGHKISLCVMTGFTALLFTSTYLNPEMGIFAAFLSFSSAMLYGPIRMFKLNSALQHVNYFLYVMIFGFVCTLFYFAIVMHDLWSFYHLIKLEIFFLEF